MPGTPSSRDQNLAADPGGGTAYLDDPAALIPGNTIRLQHNGKQAFPIWLEAIAQARRSVSLEMYIFAGDRIGRRFQAALIAAARRGVTVRLLYDFFGCRDTPESFFAELRAAGVFTIVYHRVRGWRPRFWKLLRRNHRKNLIIDSRRAFVGGLNIADEWQPGEEGGADWHDAAVDITGPAVARVETAFAATWNRRARKGHRLEPEPPGEATGDSGLAVIANSELRDRFAIRRAHRHAMQASRRRILLANPYFVPDRGILRALARASERGVDVRMLCPAASDSRFLDWAVRASFPYLLRHGVRVFLHPRVVHSKVLVVDDVFTSIGSYNLDQRSLAYNLEMVCNATDARHAIDVSAMLHSEMAEAIEQTRESFARRGILARVLQAFAYLFRRWL